MRPLRRVAAERVLRLARTVEHRRVRAQVFRAQRRIAERVQLMAARAAQLQRPHRVVARGRVLQALPAVATRARLRAVVPPVQVPRLAAAEQPQRERAEPCEAPTPNFW
jgi:hypothetical protein